MLKLPIDVWLPLLAAEIERLPASSSPIHGTEHWRAVASTAIWLARHRHGADVTVAASFGLLHDAARRNDSDDPEHGPRAAGLVRRLPPDLLQLDARQRSMLIEACEEHSRPVRSDNTTIACCFDADRLQLLRLGIELDARFLSAEAAVGDAADVARSACATPPTWSEIAAACPGEGAG